MGSFCSTRGGLDQSPIVDKIASTSLGSGSNGGSMIGAMAEGEEEAGDNRS